MSFSTYFNPQQISLTAWGLFNTYPLLDVRDKVVFEQYKRRVLDEAMFGADYLAGDIERVSSQATYEVNYRALG